MCSWKHWGGAVIGAALVLACGDAAPTSPSEAMPAVEAVDGAAPAAQAPIDVSGEWLWTREEILTVPANFAFVFGIQPEGPITHFRCELEGVITLAQDGSALSGVETETASLCETRGGQVFTQPGLGLPIPIHEGRVVGRTVHLLIGDPVLTCPIQAVVHDIDAGTATSMRGTGRCIIPGHPKSEAPPGSPLDLDPPPAGTEKILAWMATRPL